MSEDNSLIRQDEEIVDVEPVSPLERREEGYGSPDGEFDPETGHVEPVNDAPSHKRPLDYAPDSPPVQAIVYLPAHSEDNPDHIDDENV